MEYMSSDDVEKKIGRKRERDTSMWFRSTEKVGWTDGRTEEGKVGEREEREREREENRE